MNLRHLEAFRAVMVSGSVTQAAQSLNLSQPAVSKMLADLERENAEAAASLIEIGGGATVVGKLMQAFRPIDFENAIEAIAEDKSITPEAIIVGVCWWMAMLSAST